MTYKWLIGYCLGLWLGTCGIVELSDWYIEKHQKDTINVMFPGLQPKEEVHDDTQILPEYYYHTRECVFTEKGIDCEDYNI